MVDPQLRAALILLFAGRPGYDVAETIAAAMQPGQRRCELAWKLLAEEGVAVHIVGSLEEIQHEIKQNDEVFVGSEQELKNRILDMEQWDVGEQFYRMRDELLQDLRDQGLLLPAREYQDRVDRDNWEERRFQERRDAALDAAE